MCNSEALRHQRKVNATDRMAKRGLPQDEHKVSESVPYDTNLVKEYPP